MPLEKPLESITEADLQILLTDAVAEGKAIEYKESLPADSYDSRIDFLADVSSFANAAGGHLFFGIREESGVPVEICGLRGADPDAEVLRVESMMRDSIEPRLLGVVVRPIPLSNSQVVIAIRVPRSWVQPHAVTYRKHWRFYSRNSAGKYPLDVSEVRAAFALSETLVERVRLFRAERLSRIVTDETPVDIGDNPKLVLHIVPFGVLDPSVQLDIGLIDEETKTLTPIAGPLIGRRYNLDGIVAYGDSGSPPNRSYAQVFRNGAIEAVDTSILGGYPKEVRSIPSVLYEKCLLGALPRYLSVEERLGVGPPHFVMLSLLEVSGYTMGTNPKLDPFRDFLRPIDRDALLLPEVVVETEHVDAAEVMQPVFDSIWNAAGWPRCMNYDDSGNWCKGPNCRG
jgi:hypothetical protein